MLLLGERRPGTRPDRSPSGRSAAVSRERRFLSKRSADRLRPPATTASRWPLGEQAQLAVALSAERAPCRQPSWLPTWTTTNSYEPAMGWVGRFRFEPTEQEATSGLGIGRVWYGRSSTALRLGDQRSHAVGADWLFEDDRNRTTPATSARSRPRSSPLRLGPRRSPIAGLTRAPAERARYLCSAASICRLTRRPCERSDRAKRSRGWAGPDDRDRGIAQAGSAACPTVRRRESNRAPGAGPPRSA
jgi:hypothetical protein